MEHCGNKTSFRNLVWIFAIPYPQQTTTRRLFWSRWLIDQNSRHMETGNDLARSVVVYVPWCSQESKAAMGNRKTPITSCASDERHHDIPSGDVVDFDVLIRSARKKLWVVKVSNSTAKAPTQKVAASEGRLSLRKTARQIPTFDSQRCVLQQSEITRMGINLQIEDVIRGIIGTHARKHQQSHENSGSKACSG